MAKERQERTVNDKPLIPERYQHAAAIALLVVSLIAFFHEIIFGGKTFLAEDNIASHSFNTLIDDAKQQGIFPLWNPYIFCGMPSYGSLTLGGERGFDLSSELLALVIRAFSSIATDATVGRVLFYYVVLAVGMYLFTWHKLRQKIPALVAALATVFSMYIVIWIMAGHNTKIAVMAFFPFIFYLVERLREKWNTMFALLMVIALHFMFVPAHIQMIFYAFLALGIYGLFLALRALRNKESWSGIARAAAVVIVASGIAFLMDADKYLSVLEYNPYSIRGMAPIMQSSEGMTKEGGLDYEYATNWSFAPGEMMTFIIPSWYGFGVHPYQGPLSNNQVIKVNTYFGPQPFTHAPQYMGVVVLVLAVIGFVRNRKEPFVLYMGIVIVFSMLVAFGKEFPLVYDPMFKYFPMFNKFRVPSMILVLVQIFVPILAAYGLASFIGGRDSSMPPAAVKRWKYTLGGLAGIFGVALMLPSIIRGVYGAFFSQEVIGRKFTNLPAPYVAELYNFVVNAVVTDVIIGALLLLVAFGALFLYLRRSISLTTLSAVIVLAVVADLWRVAYKPMETSDAREFQQYFTMPEYVRFLQQDTTQYRVLEFINGQPPYNNTLAYWRIENAFGYQGAKMRWYQDVVDVAGLRNPLVWQLMNVRYIITNQPDTAEYLSLVYNGPDRKVYHNTSALPRAFFVNRYEVASGLDILEKIRARAFDPREVAYFVDDPKASIDPPHPAANAVITHYGIQDLQLRVTASGNNLLFLSEAYYPVGWNAYLNGSPIPIHRVNYMFRGVIVPEGVHTLEMRFEPRGFYLGKNLSLAANILVLGAMGFFTVRHFRKRPDSGQPSS